MASESPMPPVNGNYGAPHYSAAELPAHNPSGAANGASIPAAVTVPQTSGPVPAEIQDSGPSKDEVGWFFVEQYYTTLSKNPEKLPLFYNKKSQLVFGNEADRAPVSVGQRAIGERIKEIGVEDCKVRVTNVDSQESHDKSIVIQVIGEMSNRNEPHRKYVQTFVLAKQQNGYYVLNDIFRYVAEDDDDEEEAIEQPAESVSAPAPPAAKVEIKTLPSSGSLADQAKGAEIVNQKLERSADTPPAAIAAANVPAEPSAAAEATATEPSVDAASEKASDAAEPALLEPEVPKDPEPTPAVPSPAAEELEPAAATKEPIAAPKPSAPKTWASMLSSGAKVATPAVPVIPNPATPQPKKTTAPPAQTAASQQPTSSSPPPEYSALDSPGGWQTAGQEHNRKQGRVQPAPVSANTARDGFIKAYIKNVTDKVDGAILRTTLAKYGKLEYFDISRPKNCAFVEFADLAGFNAAAAANPHNIGGEDVYVEERHIKAPSAFGYNNRGSVRGRGGMDNRSNSQGGRGGFTKDGSRGGFPPRGGRGGSISRGRGMPQAA